MAIPRNLLWQNQGFLLDRIHANGTDVATVAGLLGHSQPSTTLDIYTHAFDKNKKAASEVLQKGLEI